MTLLNIHNQFKKDNYIKKLLSNARAIISNQIALPLGISKMDKILYWINQIEPLDNIDLQIFSEYSAKTINFPLGTERLLYHPDFLKQQDKQLDKLTMQYKDTIIDKCLKLLKSSPIINRSKFVDNYFKLTTNAQHMVWQKTG